jgi:hypothetical protein
MPNELTQEWKCTFCDKKFRAPHWYCKEGVNHQVESKTYYAPTEGLQVMWKTDRSYMSTAGDGTLVKVPGKTAQFVRGTFVTSDPEEQFFFDRYPGCITAEQWEDNHLTAQEKIRRQGDELNAAKRIIAEQNELLKAVKAGVEATKG